MRKEKNSKVENERQIKTLCSFVNIFYVRFMTIICQYSILPHTGKVSLDIGYT